MEPRPAMEIGLVEGESAYLFSDIEGALFLGDGRIAVADRGSSQIRYFTRDGSFDRAVGRSGAGPGEFAYIRDIGRCGADSLFVFELDRLTKVLTSAGTYVREGRPYDPATIDRRPYAIRCADNGYYAAVGWEPRVASGTGGHAPVIGFYRAEAPVWVLAPAHAVDSGIATIGHAGLVITAELGTFLSSERIGTATGSRPHPFARGVRLAISPDAVYLGTGESPEIHRYSLDGELERVMRWPATDLAIGSADLRAYRDQQLAAAEEPRRAALERSLRELPMPPAFPAFTRIEIDPRGNLWAREFVRPGSEENGWLVFDPEGELLGRLAMPRDLEVTDIADGAVLGVRRDELGVERVRIHSLRRPQQVSGGAVPGG